MVRKVPTPEVFQVILNNYELGERIKNIGDTVLAVEQLNLVKNYLNCLAILDKALSYYVLYNRKRGVSNEDVLLEDPR